MQVEGHIESPLARVGEMCPAVVLRRFQNGSRHVSSWRLLSCLELSVP